MPSPFTIDSNILIYAFDPTDSAKHSISRNVLASMLRGRAPLPMQCLAEFYSVTTRKKFLSPQRAEAVVADCQRSLIVVSAEWPELNAAMSIHRQHALQFFDCLLIATAEKAQCSFLITEDMQDRMLVRGVELFNPFVRPAAELEELLS